MVDSTVTYVMHFVTISDKIMSRLIFQNVTAKYLIADLWPGGTFLTFF